MTGTPTRIDLIRQAGGDHDAYFRLCAEHGIAPDGPPKVLGPTGLPGAAWPDQPTGDADTAVAALEVHHRLGKERTEAEVFAIAAAEADERRRLNDERVAAMDPESVSDVMRGRLAAQVARRARDRGQLDLGGV